MALFDLASFCNNNIDINRGGKILSMCFQAAELFLTSHNW